MSWSWLPIARLVGRSVLHKPATRLYPVERREPFARTRGHIEFRVNDCDFCTICAHRCPTRAIVVGKKERTWAIDHTLCILCGNCVDDCKRGCITLSTAPCPPLTKKFVQTIRQNYAAPEQQKTEAPLAAPPQVPSAEGPGRQPPLVVGLSPCEG